jgi:RNA polymerase sigma factor (sigma-70 family)
MHDDREALDCELLEAGDHATLLATYFPEVRDRLALWLSAHDADEVLQRVMLRLLSELEGGKRYPVPFRVVVRKVTEWVVKDYFRDRHGRWQPLPDEWDAADPSDGYVAVDDRSLLEELFADLPQAEREVAWLRFAEGLEIEEIARRLHKTRNAVDQALFRIRNRVRRKLDG